MKQENMKIIKNGGRIVWLDSLKGICMLCTMVGHYTFFPKDVAACYAPFFLSAFLFAAGYTFHLESSFKRFVEKKIKTVLSTADRKAGEPEAFTIPDGTLSEVL